MPAESRARRDPGETNPLKVARAAPRERFKGAVELIDPASGLSGWCADLTQPQAPVDLELLVDGLAISRTRTQLTRVDICELLAREGRFGFVFEPKSFARLEAHRHLVAERRVSVRIAGTQVELAQDEQKARLGDVLSALDPPLNGERGVLERLLAHWSAADALLMAAPDKETATTVGCVEMAAEGENGLLWFAGWCANDAPQCYPALIVDGDRRPAAVIAARFPRGDRGSDAAGMVGVMLTRWRPSPGRAAVFLMDERGERRLRAAPGLELSDIAEALGHLRSAAGGEDRLVARQLLDFMRAHEKALDDGSGDATRVVIDDAAQLAGFGVLLAGVIFSPARVVKRLALRVGDRVIEGDPVSLSFAPRADLASQFPAAAEAISRAGFRCVFRTPAACAGSPELALQVHYEGGGASSHRLAEVVIQRIAPDSDGGRFRDFYPHMERQPLFADYARAYYTHCRARYGDCRMQVFAPATFPLVFVAPPERHRLYLMFERLRENLRWGGAGGVVVLAEEQARDGELQELFHSLRGDFAGPCSLGFVADSQNALYALDSVLLALNARNFAYVGPDAILSRNGWETVAALTAVEPRIVFLELDDPCEPWSRPERSMRAFAWTTEAFLEWRRRRFLPLGAPPSAATWSGDFVSRPKCGVLTALAAGSPTLDLINAYAGAAPRGAV